MARSNSQLNSIDNDINNDRTFIMDSDNTSDETTNTLSTGSEVTDAGIDSEETSTQPPLFSSEEQRNSGESSLSNEDEDDGIIITTNQGKIRGLPWNGTSDIMAFIDIPYGKFETLFQAPQAHDPWDDIRENSEHKIRCPQLEETEETGVVDCLTLSIFAPTNAQNASVLFHIHDGNFVSGSGDPTFYGPEYLVTKGVILVLPNYRLGPLGFLCLQNETVPGNAALKDLTLALKWTKEHIENFGGNNLNIVVSGDGTSSALAQYLALSPTSKDYISKVIAESGSVLSHWAIDREPVKTAEMLAEKIRNSERQNIILQDNLFDNIDLYLLLLSARDLIFKPCVEKNDDAFMSKTPWYILQEKKNNKTFMIGSASHAGIQEAFDQDDNSLSELDKDFSTFLPNDLFFDRGDVERNAVADTVRTQYFGNKSISTDVQEDLSLCYTDTYYLGPTVRLARSLLEAGATVYFYEFSFVGSFNWELIYLGHPIQGTARRDIIGYLFKRGYEVKEGDTDAIRMMELLTDLWVNFIDTGIPSADGVEWTALTKTNGSEEEWLSLDSNPEMQQGIHLDRLKLWTEIYEAHFVERNVGRVLRLPYALFFIATISLLAVFPKSLNS
ncbi:esterase FE4 [Aphomia sociella]